MKHPSLPIAIGLLLLALIACNTVVETSVETDVRADETLVTALRAAPAGEKIRVIVTLPSMERARSLAATFAANEQAGNGRVYRSYENFPLLALEIHENALEALRRAPGIVAVTPDRDDFPLLDTSLGVINAGQVHALGFDGAGFTIAILDTGIDEDHPFFGDRIVSQACYSSHDPDDDRRSLCPGDATSSIAAGSADTDIARCNNNGALCDHGTHVAGIAAGDGTGVTLTNAQLAGVAPAADIIAIQVFHRRNLADSCLPAAAPCVVAAVSDQIAGLDRVFTLRNAFTIVAANMSLGGGNFTATCDADQAGRKTAIDALLGENIATVIASGNNNIDNAVGAPACISTAVTVGATDNLDNVTRNRGPLLDLFAPGSGITSAGANTGFVSKGGTSMAAPHVAGAWAILRQVYPDASVATILNVLQTTGVPITYDSGGGTDNVTTPRIDLLAAVQASADPPTLTVDVASVTVDEGQTATNTGTFTSGALPVTLTASVGSVTDEGGDAWSWSFATVDGPAQTQTVTITATDSLGQDGEITFALVVDNVAPSVDIDLAQVATIAEGDGLLVTAHFTDPGTLDLHTVTVICHTVGGPQTTPGTIAITSTSPVTAGTVTATCTYGDASYPTFGVSVSVEDSDGGEGSAGFNVTVANVDPTAAIDTSAASLINGVPTFIAAIGVPVTFDGNATDPGSDDIEMEWDWDDGASTLTMYLANPPAADPKPSPDVDPRDVDDTQTHTWFDACFYTITLTARDDDGGKGSDAASVVIVGDSGRARSLGYWQTEYRGTRGVFDAATRLCYLAIAGHMSAVFHGVVDASTVTKAANVLFPRGRSTMTGLVDGQLLAAWLNFANGAYGWDELVDTTGDKLPDTAFSVAVLAAEAVRLDPLAPTHQLEAQKDILERINLMHE